MPLSDKTETVSPSRLADMPNTVPSID